MAYDFSSHSKEYEETLGKSHKYFMEAKCKELLRTIRKCNPQKILDLGCGTGEAEKILCRYLNGITGIDSSEGMIHEAKKKNMPNCEFQQADVLELPFPNGAFARIFNGKGEVKRTGFFAYDDSARGGSRVLVTDLDHNGIKERIVADTTWITITSGDRTIAHFAPYGTVYKLGMSLAVGNVDGDARLEIVTGAGRGGGPHVRMFQIDGTALGSFFAYDKKFTGGISVAVGDVNADGKDEIVTGPGRGGGPQVRIFTPAGKSIGAGFVRGLRRNSDTSRGKKPRRIVQWNLEPCSG